MINDITFFVSTRGKLDKRPITLLSLKLANLLEKTILVCPSYEANAWEEIRNAQFPGLRIWVRPDTIQDLGSCRAWMVENCPTRYVFLMDDDITFSHQYEDACGDRITRPAETDVARLRYHLYDYVLEKFQSYPAVAIGSRPFCNGRKLELENHKTGWAYGYDIPVVMEDLRPAFRRMKLHSDVDWCLTLLESGHKNIVLSHIVVSTRKESRKPKDGGCGIYRTAELVKHDTELYISLHPGIVIPREPREGLPDNTQYNQTVRWKLAYRPKQEKS